MTRHHAVAVVLVVIALPASLHVAADQGAEDETTPATSASTKTPAKDADEAPPSADEVLRQILKTRKTRSAIAPIEKPVVEAGHGGAPVRGDQLLDGRVLGTAPGAAKPKLRREGEFVPLRRGRIVRAPGSNQVMFVFDADSRQAPEPPMFIMPCQELESIERIVAERGDKIVLNLAGQVFTYRGANYILPGQWNMVADKGNLKK